MTEGRARMTVDELLSAARSRLQRLDPAAASDAVAAGAVLIDIRSERQRERDGVIANAHLVLPLVTSVVAQRAGAAGKPAEPPSLVRRRIPMRIPI